MRATLLPLVFVVIVGLTYAGCTGVRTDIGKTCTLVKALADGGSTHVLVTDLQDSNGQVPPGQDVISFGPLECSSQVCVIDASQVPAALTAANKNPAAGIQGYCSGLCTSNADCAVQYNHAEQTAGNAMTCRGLVLDQAAINTLCTNDPVRCQQYFGTNQSSFYCARGTGSADAGI